MPKVQALIISPAILLWMWRLLLWSMPPSHTSRFQSFKKFTNLQILLLTDGQISNIHPGAFEGFGKQRQNRAFYSISLSKNKLHQLKANIWQSIATLNVLNLDHNNISVLRSGVFSTLGGRSINLNHLGLGQNSISVIESGTWSGLTQLSVLCFSGNKLKELPPSIFSGLASLLHLNLDNNLITTVNYKAFTGVPLLSAVQFGCNQLDTFISESLEYRNSLYNETKVKILFSCNPLKCGPDICWMKESDSGWISTLTFDLSDSHLTCHNKDHTTTLLPLNQVDLNCSKNVKKSIKVSEGKFRQN